MLQAAYNMVLKCVKFLSCVMRFIANVLFIAVSELLKTSFNYINLFVCVNWSIRNSFYSTDVINFSYLFEVCEVIDSIF